MERKVQPIRFSHAPRRSFPSAPTNRLINGTKWLTDMKPYNNLHSTAPIDTFACVGNDIYPTRAFLLKPSTGKKETLDQQQPRSLLWLCCSVNIESSLFLSFPILCLCPCLYLSNLSVYVSIGLQSIEKSAAHGSNSGLVPTDSPSTISRQASISPLTRSLRVGQLSENNRSTLSSALADIRF